jgi:hypothetical protein
MLDAARLWFDVTDAVIVDIGGGEAQERSGRRPSGKTAAVASGRDAVSKYVVGRCELEEVVEAKRVVIGNEKECAATKGQRQTRDHVVTNDNCNGERRSQE